MTVRRAFRRAPILALSLVGCLSLSVGGVLVTAQAPAQNPQFQLSVDLLVTDARVVESVRGQTWLMLPTPN